ncbi:M56 family metallopeptidase [Chryseolinea sp. T2]|uniref:M56 family metallopeptidase n=1 Tax=Chryseolinea sp. T2 TaxID=3129255 RepID=UPI003077A235
MSHALSNYLIELSAIHVTLMLGYWIFLRKERQYGIMRFCLLGSVVVALIIPLLKLPRLFSVEEPVYEFAYSPAVASSVVSVAPAQTSFWSFELLLVIYGIMSSVLLIMFLNSLRQLFLLRRKGRCEQIEKLRIYRIASIKGSFSFFNSIFINKEIDPNGQAHEVMVAHERAHAVHGHTYDIVLLQLFRVFFWWLPTAWIINREIKRVHEYQADNCVLQSYSVEEYSAVLINSTLTLHGLSLASSFHDSLILKRLTAMRQQTKRVSAWKLGVLSGLCTLLIIGFACTEEAKSQRAENSTDQSKAEIFTIVEKAPEYNGGIGAFRKNIMEEIKYPLEARQKGITGRVDVQFVIDKDGSLTDVKAINNPGGGCDIEAERALRNIPPFTPASQQGKPVKVRMMVPIVFMLDDKSKNPKGVISIDEVQPLNAKMKVNASYSEGEWTGYCLR